MNVKKPRVSVVMPTHNRANELPRSIRSVLCQSFNDFELIVVDDASTDETSDIIDGFTDPRIVYQKLDKNVGGAEARNVGIRLAKAEIIAFQDSDDEWTCSKLEIAVSELVQHDDFGAVFSRFIQISPDGCQLMPNGVYSFDPNAIYESLLWQNHVDTPTLVVRKKCLDEVGGFTPEMPRYQDWDLALKLAKVTRIKYLKEPMLLSYVTCGSITQNKDAHGVALEILYKKHCDAIFRNKALKAAWFHRLGDAKMQGEEKQGRMLLFKAFKCEPSNLRYLIKFLFSVPGNGEIYNKLIKPFKT
jgi:glycosyltransferase involved in cell wall biosynthesis